MPRHFGVPRNSENATVIYLKILKLCRDNKKVENHWHSVLKSVFIVGKIVMKKLLQFLKIDIRMRNLFKTVSKDGDKMIEI